jgi:eukaryotic-like serine/threonine-protein kinase
MWAQVNAEVPSVGERRPDVPPALEELTRRAMAKEPEARPTASAFRASALAAVGAPA